MKKLNKIITIMILSFIGVLSLFSCDKPEENVFIAEVVNSNMYYTFTSDSVILINDNATLHELCKNAPDYDFKNSSLLLCGGIVPRTGIAKIFVELDETEENSYTLNVTILRNAATIGLEEWSRFVITSGKIADNTSIDINVEIIDGIVED